MIDLYAWKLPNGRKILVIFSGEYSIAGVSTYPWAARHEWHKTEVGHLANVIRWYDAIGARAAVHRDMAIPA